MGPVKSTKSRKSTRADGGNHICETCGESIRNRGKKQHKCEGNGTTSLDDVFKEMAEQEALERARQLSLMANEPNNPKNQGQSSKTMLEDLAWSETLPSPMQEELDEILPPGSNPRDPNEPPIPPMLHDIKITFHPNSHRPDRYIRDDHPHSGTPEPAAATVDTPVLEKPWHPFRSRLDFEVAEFALSSHLNKSKTDALLSIIKRCIKEPEQHTLKDHNELIEYWDLARTKATGFEKKTISVPYKDKEEEFDVWTRSLWTWCEGLLNDPKILSNIQWDAQRIFKYNGHRFERCIDEPWTADALWEIQSKLPDGAKPLCILLYADKTRLSTFGTAKAHPVIARCASLPIEMRNGEDIDGGWVVGWLPIVKEDSGQSGKAGYVNMKRVVWHEAFLEILKTIESYAKLGCMFNCADGVLRWIFPIILILSADYEEQCIMALIRGLNSHRPCPVCLIPGDCLSDLSETYPLRTTETMRAIYEEAQEARTVVEKQELLKEYGLRNVKNVFWILENTDVYAAISWDRLHAYHGGLFSDHLWVRFKEIIKDLGKPFCEKFDTQIDSIPRWKDLNHFSKLLKNSDFADGTKYEDMGKIVIYGGYNILSAENTAEGFLLLQVMRSYLELDMYASLTMHTEATLTAGRAELQTYNSLIQEYKQRFPHSKSWNFPKAHTHQHLFDDIEKKGATRGYNSKPNEKRHRPFKAFYLFNTNFKDTDEQILKLEERSVIALIIRRGIEALDAMAEPSDSEDAQLITESASEQFQRITVGSPLPSMTLADIERNHQDDIAWTGLRKKIGKAFTGYFSRRIAFNSNDEVTVHQYLKASYNGTLDARETRTDILRVNPKFHGSPRYDYVLIKVDASNCMFAQLLTIFTINCEGKAYCMALILPMDRPTLIRNRGRDRTLRLTRVRSRTRNNSIVVDTETIIRRALLTSEHDSPGEFFVLDTIDDDFWWRMKSVNLAQNVSL